MKAGLRGGFGSRTGFARAGAGGPESATSSRSGPARTLGNIPRSPRCTERWSATATRSRATPTSPPAKPARDRLRLLANEYECQAGDDERREKDRQKPLAGASEGDGFAVGGVEGLSTA